MSRSSGDFAVEWHVTSMGNVTRHPHCQVQGVCLCSLLQMICRDDFLFAVPCSHRSASETDIYLQGEPARRHRGACRHSSFSTTVFTERSDVSRSRGTPLNLLYRCSSFRLRPLRDDLFHNGLDVLTDAGPPTSNQIIFDFWSRHGAALVARKAQAYLTNSLTLTFRTCCSRLTGITNIPETVSTIHLPKFSYAPATAFVNET
jgi:hypothetical protein